MIGPESQMKAFEMNTKGSRGTGVGEEFDENRVQEDESGKMHKLD